jgi:mannan endo-1,4-beta-mannosidase
MCASCPSSPKPVDSSTPTTAFIIPDLPAPEPLPNKIRLLNYLSDVYGKNIISGQMDTSWTLNRIMDMVTRVYTDTGKYPAIKGFDFIQLPTRAVYQNGGEQVNEAIEWWEGKNNSVPLLSDKEDIHGIVTFCWHWRAAPENEFYTNQTKFRIPWKNGKLDTESAAFTDVIISDLDKVAVHLATLRDRGIPVLWRPLHEATGGWFWWGASGAGPYKALWEFMHQYLTNVKQLNNLIWVWNAENANWFPNPATVDIIGRDLYAQNYSSQKQEFTKNQAMAPAKDRMVALSENGKIPDPDECIKDGAMWLWFMTWNDRSGSTQGETHKDNFWTGEATNTQAHKMKVYHHPAVITLDKLPDLTKYRLE